jgi:hypothetical protein
MKGKMSLLSYRNRNGSGDEINVIGMTVLGCGGADWEFGN